MLNIKNKNSNSLVRITKHELKKDTTTLLAPDNTLELFQVLKGSVIIQLVGKARKLNIQAGRYFLLKPRSRGMKIKADLPASIRIINIAPLQANRLTHGHMEVANGVYSMSNNSMEPDNFNQIVNTVNTTKTDMQNSDAVIKSIDIIKNAKGRLKVMDLYSGLNISKSTLEQHFIKEIGLTPKEYCKIEKLNNFIASYKDNQGRTLTELTYQCGYYDQSHLIKDFHYFLETSPKKYLAEN